MAETNDTPSLLPLPDIFPRFIAQGFVQTLGKENPDLTDRLEALDELKKIAQSDGPEAVMDVLVVETVRQLQGHKHPFLRAAANDLAQTLESMLSLPYKKITLESYAQDMSDQRENARENVELLRFVLRKEFAVLETLPQYNP